MYDSYIYKSYILGFILSVILTIIPFFIVVNNLIINQTILSFIIICCAIIQIGTHLICFLHIGNISNKTWIIMSLTFTILIIFILIFGSIWIMMHLHKYLML